MERYIAFDIGTRRIGVAVSDPYNTYALPSVTYVRRTFDGDIEALAALAKEKGATVAVCGMPVNTDGTASAQTEKTARFVETLKDRIGIPVVCEDERFTTVMADETLISEGMDAKKRRNYVDAVAAANILDGYLSRLNGGK